MNRFLAFVLSTVLCATLGLAPLISHAATRVPGEHLEADHRYQAERTEASHQGQKAAASACLFHCTAATIRAVPWLQDARFEGRPAIFSITATALMHNAAPEVPRRPPKKVFV